jgi:uncharacterized protein (DUF1697 family)
MADLAIVVSEAGLMNVRTYIQSGNVIFESIEESTAELAQIIHSVLLKSFALDVDVAVFSESDWRRIIDNAPDWWGQNQEWKHNLIVLLKPYNIKEVVEAIGPLKPDIEAMEPGDGVIYQSMSFKLFGRTTTGKIASSPIYKRMTIRNYNTATKLLGLMQSVS